MNKSISILLLLLCTSLVYGSRKEDRMALQVQVIADEYDENVPEGKCKITGTVYYYGELYKGAEVCSYNGKKCVKTNKNGEFTLVVDTSEANVYATIIGSKISYLQNYKFESQHHVVLKFYLEDKYTTVKKPVVYLYSDEPLALDLKLRTDVELTFTYPLYEDGWKLSVDPEDGLHVAGKQYPYLFWEGKDYGALSYASNDGQLIGQIIDTDTVIPYLEKMTTNFGMNSTEATDFITFWGPILSAQNYAFVQFVLDDDYDKIAAIESSTAITNERRVFMLFESYSSFPAGIQVTNTQPSAGVFTRKGLTLVEWGGAEVPLLKI